MNEIKKDISDLQISTGQKQKMLETLNQLDDVQKHLKPIGPMKDELEKLKKR